MPGILADQGNEHGAAVVEHDDAAVREPAASACSGPPRTAAFARVSASSAVGAIAVACTTPVNAGRPVAGSSRWWAGSPSRPSQLRRPMPLVATPASASLPRVQRPVRRTGSSTCTCTGLAAADPEVAGAVDGEALVAGERLGEGVGEQALGEAAGVELEAGRAVDGERVEVDGDGGWRGRGAWARGRRGAAGRRAVQRVGERERGR